MLFSITFTIFSITINHLYSTCASPIVSKGAGQLLNLTHPLAKCVNIPPDQLCDNPGDWVRRECVTGLSDLEWEDTCLPDHGSIYWRVGECTDDTMCQNTLTQDLGDEEPVETISCIERPRNNSQVAPDEQSGVYGVSNTSHSSHSRTVSVIVETNLVDATVSGLVEGMYRIPTDPHPLIYFTDNCELWRHWWELSHCIIHSRYSAWHNYEALWLQRNKSGLRTHWQTHFYSRGRCWLHIRLRWLANCVSLLRNHRPYKA